MVIGVPGRGNLRSSPSRTLPRIALNKNHTKKRGVIQERGPLVTPISVGAARAHPTKLSRVDVAIASIFRTRGFAHYLEYIRSPSPICDNTHGI